MKKIWVRLLLAACLFVMIIVGLLFFKGRENKSEMEYSAMEKASFPVITFSFEGYEADLLYGYKEKEAAESADLLLLPIDDDRKISMNIKTFGNSITEASARLLSLDDGELIEEKQWDLVSENGEDQFIPYQASVLMENEKEYLLSICVKMQSGEKVWYSVRTAVSKLTQSQRMIDFAEKISSAVLSKDETFVRSLFSYDKEKSGTDLSEVNLNTSYNLVTWAGLSPKAGQKILQISEWSENQMTAAFQYRCFSEYEGEEAEYDVTESMVIRTRDEKDFLLAYNRKTEEEFASKKEKMGLTSIPLGITKAENLDLLYGAYGKYMAFCVDGSAWFYDYNTNTMSEMFSFFASEEYDIRESRKDHIIKLIGMDDKYNVYFYVSGYMNAGKHEGRQGIAVYQYDSQNNTLHEFFFAETKDASQENLENMGKICYRNEENLLYLNFDGTIYAIDLNSMECQIFAEDAANIYCEEKKGLACWQEEKDRSVIYLLDMENGKLCQIRAENGNSMETFGFVQEDLAYGVKADVSVSVYGYNMRELFSELFIVNRNGEEEIKFSSPNTYIEKVEVRDQGVLASCLKNTEKGLVKADDEVISLTKTETKLEMVEIKIATSEVKRNYYYINIGKAVLSEKTYNEQKASWIDEKEQSLPLIAGEKKDTDGYIAYAYGKPVGQFDHLSEAIHSVYDQMGSVRKGNQEIWNRGVRDYYLTVPLPVMSWTQAGKEEIMASMNSLQRGVDILIYSGEKAGVITKEEAGNEERKNCSSFKDELELCLSEHLLDLTGAKLQETLYYLNLRHPVLCVTSEDTSYILNGYAYGTINIYDPATRETKVWEIDEAQAFFDSQNTAMITFW